jgi:oligogalacturonide lyase
MTRRTCLASLLAAGAAIADGKKGELFPASLHRYSDPTTDLDVIRLTDPVYSSVLTAWYNRDIARSSGWMLLSCDRAGTPQVMRLDLKSGEMRELTDAPELDSSSVSLTPDNRAFCFFSGRSLFHSSFATSRERELYEIPEGWDRCAGMSVAPDGGHAVFAEQKGEGSRLRFASLLQGATRTVVEAPFAISHPQGRPSRAQAMYLQGAEAVWLVNLDGQQNRKLKLAAGKVANPQWSRDGKTILYLNIPEDRTQLNAIREYAPDTNTDKLVAKTSQFGSFDFNRDSSVFVGASGNKSSPVVLILLRVTRRELTLCEHRASDVPAVAPRFAPDSQRVYFQSDREGKPSLYCIHVEKLVEKTEAESK